MTDKEFKLLHRYLDGAITEDELESLEELLRNNGRLGPRFVLSRRLMPSGSNLQRTKCLRNCNVHQLLALNLILQAEPKYRYG